MEGTQFHPIFEILTCLKNLGYFIIFKIERHGQCEKNRNCFFSTGVVGDYLNKTVVYIFMLPIAGKTVGPNGLKFFVDTYGWPGGVIGKNNSTIFLQNSFILFFPPRALPGPAA